MKTKVAVVIPNWNGKTRLKSCLDSVISQTANPHVVVVENGSTDGSLEYIQKTYPDVEVVAHSKNLGFAGGVNSGIKRVSDLGFEYVALLNNDAIVDKNWAKHLLDSIAQDKSLGAVACKLLSSDKKSVDSTGDFYSIWGLPFNRDRGKPAKDAHTTPGLVFGPCAGAALYRVAAIEEVGMFDDDFFAYHEDADIHFRLQLYGWKTMYQPKAIAYHATGSTSSKIPGFTTYQTFKNYPLLFWKNVPTKLLPKMLPRFTIAYTSIFVSSLLGGRGWPATKGFSRMLTLLPKKLAERRKIQKNRKVSIDYIDSILVQDLPANSHKLRRLRSIFRRK